MEPEKNTAEIQNLRAPSQQNMDDAQRRKIISRSEYQTQKGKKADVQPSVRSVTRRLNRRLLKSC
jgi:hypothetical protein